MTTLYEQMADEFCRWPLPPKWDGTIIGTGGLYLSHAEALAMFQQIVGPKIAELEAERDLLHHKAEALNMERGYLEKENGIQHTKLVAAEQRAAEWAGMCGIKDAQITVLEADNVALRHDNKRLQQQHEMDYAVMAGDTALIAGLRSDIAALEVENERLRKAFEKPVGRVEHRKDTTQYGITYTHLPAGTQLFTKPEIVK